MSMAPWIYSSGAYFTLLPPAVPSSDWLTSLKSETQKHNIYIYIYNFPISSAMKSPALVAVNDMQALSN